MRTKISKQQKSGFSEGRSKTGPSRSTIGKKKEQREPEDKVSKKLEKGMKKLSKIREDLVDVYKDVDFEDGNPFDTEATDETGKPISRFASDFGKIRRAIIKDGSEFNAEAAHRAILKTTMSMALDLMPIIEIALRTNVKEQAVYANIAMMEQIKGISSELKMLGNVENQSAFIKESIIQPLFMALVQLIMQQIMSLKNTVDTEFGGYSKLEPSVKTVKREMDAMMKNLGSFIDASREGMSNNIGSYLSGDMAFLNADRQATGGRRGSKGRRQ